MGEYAEVLSTAKTTDSGAQVREVTADPGGGANVTAELGLPPGVDAQPLPGDTVALVAGPGEGRKIAVGFTDPKSPLQAGDGEHRLYVRDSEGEPVAEIWLKSSGAIVIEVKKEGGAPITIKSEGVVHLDSPDVRLSAGGQPVACVGDLVSGVVHALTTSPGNPVAPGPPVPGGGVPFAGT